MRAKRRLLGAFVAILLALALDPLAATARQSMSFSPGDRSRVHRATPQRHVARGRSHGRSQGRAMRHASSAADGSDEGEARAVPGGGFKMENGVLTYPAPARFQPKNLKRR